MKRFLLLLLTLSLTAGLIACAPKDTAEPPAEETTAAATAAPTAPESGENTDRLPDFTVLDGEGNPVKLSDFYGKPIVLNFWASWCPPCKAELPDFEAACQKYAGKVTFLMVNLTDGQRETVSIAKSFVESAGYTFPVYYDTTYEASMTFGIRSIPQTFFIDAAGTPVASATGMISAAQLEEGIGMIYSE